MDALSSSDVFLFGPFRFDRRRGVLLRCNDEGRYLPVSIGSRAFAVLGVLIARPGDLVSRDEIMRAAWPGTVVEEGNLAVQISALRRILDAGTQGESCIQTVSGRGYRFAPRVAGGCIASRGAGTGDRSNPTAIVSSTRAGVREVMAPPDCGIGGRRDRRIADGGVVARRLVDKNRRSATPLDRRVAAREPERRPEGRLPGRRHHRRPDHRSLRAPGMFVIARESAYTYRGKTVDIRKVGEELGVRYVLEGSVHKLGEMLRVNAQLIATETGAHLWADRFDQQLNDLSAGQDAIVRRIGQTLDAALADVESARSKRERPTNPDAFDLIQRARALGLHPTGDELDRTAKLRRARRPNHRTDPPLSTDP